LLQLRMQGFDQVRMGPTTLDFAHDRTTRGRQPTEAALTADLPKQNAEQLEIG
jgi:hypothetical protein